MSHSRLFIAYEIPDDLTAEIALIQKKLFEALPTAFLGVIPAVQLHITLSFLGKIDQTHISYITNVLNEFVQKTSTHSFSFEDITIMHGNHLNDTKAIVLALKQDGPHAERFKAHIDSALEEIGIQKSNREWKPHITIARTKSHINQSDLEVILLTHTTFTCTEISLFESTLTNQGATYTRISTATLL